MENPYQAPAPDPTRHMLPAAEHQLAQAAGWVRAFAGLSLVQAFLELMLGVMLLLFVWFVVSADEFNGELPPWFGAYMFAIAAIHLGLGVLRGVAAVCNWQFRGRILGIVAASVGLVTMFTCYCAPTAIALFVFALLLFLNESARTLFVRRRKGPVSE
jgi:hypothetical protein